MLEIKNLNLSLNNKKICQNINFSAKSGEIIVITGGNGSGKTSLLKCIIGINKHTGQVILDNQDISSLPIYERVKSGISFAFQEPITFKGITVRKLFEIALNDKKFKIDNACDYLSKVGLCARDYIDRNFDKNLSGGEKKRIELALSLAQNKKVNIFDEPEAGIDIWSFENLVNIFKELKNQEKIILIVSHNKKIMEIANKIIVLDNGKIKEMGKPDDILPNLSSLSCIKLQGGNN